MTISTNDIAESGSAQPVRLPSSFLSDSDKQPEHIFRVDEMTANLTMSGEKTLFLFDREMHKSGQYPFYMMTGNDIVGIVELGYSFPMDFQDLIATRSCHKIAGDVPSSAFGCRIIRVEKFETPVTVLQNSGDVFIEVDSPTVKAGVQSHVWKQAAPVEERIIAAAVLVPGRTDLHKEIYDEDAVRGAAHYFLANYRKDDDHGIDVLHDGNVVPDSIVPIESYVLDRELSFSIDTPAIDGEADVEKSESITFPRGTWLMYAKVISDTLWNQVKDGSLRSWSIYGLASVRQLRKML